MNRQQETRRQASYASLMHFNNLFAWDNVSWVNEDLTNRSIVFVRTREEAEDFGFQLDTIVGWPSAYSLGVLEALNKIIDTDERMEQINRYLDAIDFGHTELSKPLTVDDLIYNWYSIRILLARGITRTEEREVRNHAESNYFAITVENRTLQHLLFPSRLDAINEMAIGRSVNDERIERINRIHRTEFDVFNLPMPPFTEEDVHNNPRLIASITRELLTMEELMSVSIERLIQQHHDKIAESGGMKLVSPFVSFDAE